MTKRMGAATKDEIHEVENSDQLKISKKKTTTPEIYLSTRKIRGQTS